MATGAGISSCAAALQFGAATAGRSAAGGDSRDICAGFARYSLQKGTGACGPGRGRPTRLPCAHRGRLRLPPPLLRSSTSGCGRRM